MPRRIIFEGDPTPQLYEDAVLGFGQKGQVYRSVDKRHVVKLLKIAQMSQVQQEQQRGMLRLLVRNYNIIRGQPYWANLFAWPDRLIERVDGSDAVGVRMAFVPFKPLHNRLERFPHADEYSQLKKGERGWWIASVAIGMKLARALRYLEDKQLTHTDISGKNIHGDAYTGAIRLLDCDGVMTISTDTLVAQVMGTPFFMAPELVAGDARRPGIETDRHALAVFLHRLLLDHHPLRGPRGFPGVNGDEAERLAFGREALYIHHPRDDRNRPPYRHMSASALGTAIEDLFEIAFVDGLHEPGLRPPAHEWERVLTRLYDRVIPCVNPHCRHRFFPAPEFAGPLICCFCGRETRGPRSLLYLTLKKPDDSGREYVDDDYTIVGWPGRVLHEWHFSTRISPAPDNPMRRYDPRPAARIEYDPAGDRWYLINERSLTMRFVGARAPTPPDLPIRLEDNHQIYLTGASDTRLAVVSIIPTAPGPVILQLPDIETHDTSPWPTLRPTPADTGWVTGSPVTQRPYAGFRPAPIAHLLGDRWRS